VYSGQVPRPVAKHRSMDSGPEAGWVRGRERRRCVSHRY
jgi:hypothetical protein